MRANFDTIAVFSLPGPGSTAGRVLPTPPPAWGLVGQSPVTADFPTHPPTLSSIVMSLCVPLLIPDKGRVSLMLDLPFSNLG
jgi:hypothetical protein